MEPVKDGTRILSILLASVLVFVSISSTQVWAEKGQVTDPKYFNFDSDTGTITGYDSAGGKEIIIPSSIDGIDVKKIGKGAFWEKDLKTVTIPDTIKVIREAAFTNSTLNSVVLGNNVEVIKENAFEACQLSSVNIPDTIKVIEDEAFGFNNLTAVEIPEGIKYLSGFTFNKLNSIEIPVGVKTIGFRAFMGNNLTEIELPASVEVIRMEAFAANNLKKVKIGKGVDIKEFPFSEGAIEGNFKEVYEASFRTAGVYVREDKESDWHKQE